MQYHQRLSRGFRYFLWFAAFFAIIAILSKSNKLSFLDIEVTRFVQSTESSALTFLANGLSLIGSWKMVIVISLFTMALLYIGFKQGLELILFVWVGLGSQLLNTLLKLWFHRERPNLHRLIEEIGYSFPSGHAMAAFSLYGLITILLWRHLPDKHQRIILSTFTVFMTLGIGLSRIYLGVHYPSDVIGGYMAGGAWLMLSICLFEIYKSSRSHV